MNNQSLNTLFSAFLSHTNASRTSAYMGFAIADSLAISYYKWLAFERPFKETPVSKEMISMDIKKDQVNSKIE